MTRFHSLSLIAFAFLATLSVSAVRAQEFMPPHHDDSIVLDLNAEDWVTTKTAHVSINVEAAVSAGNSGTMRADMSKAVNDLSKADWRLTSFNRSQDQTGLERWSTSFEARLPENQLSGLGEAVKKASKAGMQLSVSEIDFSPTLEENEAARSALRIQIYKQVNDQLAAVNAAISGRNYRIALIDFTGGEMPPPSRPMMVRPMMARAMNGAMAVASAPSEPPQPPEERAEKITLMAHVVFAAVPDHNASDTKH